MQKTRTAHASNLIGSQSKLCLIFHPKVSKPGFTGILIITNDEYSIINSLPLKLSYFPSPIFHPKVSKPRFTGILIMTNDEYSKVNSLPLKLSYFPSLIFLPKVSKSGFTG